MDKKYTNLPQIQYTPSPSKSVRLAACIENLNEYNELCAVIDRLQLPEIDTLAMRLLAARHVRFNFGAIADHYAAASPEEQRVLETLGAVFVDKSDAILRKLQEIYLRAGEEMPEMPTTAAFERQGTEQLELWDE